MEYPYSQIIQQKREVHQVSIRRREKETLLKKFREKILKDVVDRTEEINQNQFLVHIYKFIVELLKKDFSHIHFTLKFLFDNVHMILRSYKIQTQIKSVRFVECLVIYIQLFCQYEMMVQSGLEILILLSSYDEMEDQFDSDLVDQVFSNLIFKNPEFQAQIIWIMGNLLYSKNVRDRTISFLKNMQIEERIFQCLKKNVTSRQKSLIETTQQNETFSTQMKKSLFHFLAANFRYHSLKNTQLNVDFEIRIYQFTKAEFFNLKEQHETINILLPLLKKCHFSDRNQSDIKIILAIKNEYDSASLNFILDISFRYDWITFELLDILQPYCKMLLSDHISDNDTEQILKIFVNVSINSDAYEYTSFMYELITMMGFKKLWKKTERVRQESLYLIKQILRVTGSCFQLQTLIIQALQLDINPKIKLQLVATLKTKEITDFTESLCEQDISQFSST